MKTCHKISVAEGSRTVATDETSARQSVDVFSTRCFQRTLGVMSCLGRSHLAIGFSLLFSLFCCHNASAIKLSFTSSQWPAVFVSEQNGRSNLDGSVTASIVIQNWSDTWVYVEQTFPERNKISASLPYTVFLLGPGYRKTINNVKFFPNSYLHFEATTANGANYSLNNPKASALFGALTIDMLARGILTFPFSPSAFDKPPSESGVVDPFIDEIFKSLFAEIGELAVALKNRDSVAAATALGKIALESQRVRDTVSQLLRKQFTSEQVNSFFNGTSSLAGQLLDLLNLIGKAKLLGDLTSATFNVPATSWARIDATGSNYLSPPANLKASAVSTSQINVSWLSVAGAESYVVQRRISGGEFATIIVPDSRGISFADRNLLSNRAYQYQVAAKNSTGQQSSFVQSSVVPLGSEAGARSYTLTLNSSNPSSGVTISSFEGSSAVVTTSTPESRSFASGANVGVSCPPTLSTGKVFQKWMLDGSDYGYDTYATVVMNAPHTLTAVYTSPSPGLARVLSGISITGPSFVNEGSSTQYFAKAFYTDGSAGDVSSTVTWLDSSSYADVASNGVLDASAVSSDETVRIDATYRESYPTGSVTKTATRNVTINNVVNAVNFSLNLSATNGYITPSPKMSSYPAGTEVRLRATADDDYVFSGYSGDVSGTDRTVYVTMNSSKSVTANFTRDLSTGNLAVSFNPPQAAAEGAQWKYRNYTNWRDAGTQDNIPPGSGYINFKDIPGWVTPEGVRQEIVGGQTSSVTATYQEILGTLQVSISPTEAVAAGARWRIDGGPWTEGGSTLNDVSMGTHRIEYLPISGWSTPNAETITVNRNSARAHAVSYGAPAGLPLITKIIPSTGALEGGTTVEIEGSSFGGDVTVEFGGVSASDVIVSDPNHLTCILPPASRFGTVDVALTSGGQTATKPAGFTYDVPLGTNMTLLSQIGGTVEAVAVSGSTVLFGEGSSLVSADYSNPRAPVIRGRLPLPGLVKDIWTDGNIALIANKEWGLLVVDVSNLGAMRRIGFYDTPGSTPRMAVSGKLAYLVEQGLEDVRGLKIVDFSNPEVPTLVGSYLAPDATFDVGLTDIGSKKIACLSTQYGGVLILDVSDPADVSLLSTVEQGTWNGKISVDGSLVSVTGAYNGNASNPVGKLYDISNPQVPLVKPDWFRPPVFYAPLLANGYVYSADSDLRIYSANDFSQSLGNVDTGGEAVAMVSAGSLLYIAASEAGLVVVDVSSPTAPSVLAKANATFSAKMIGVSRGRAYVALGSGNFSSLDVAPVLKTLDVSDRRGPRIISTTSANDSVDRMVFNDHYIFGIGGRGGLATFSLADPNRPELISQRSGLHDSYALALLGQNVIAGDQDGEAYPFLRTYDGINVSSQAALSSVQISPGKGIIYRGLTAFGSTVFVVKSRSELLIYDFANIQAPRLLGSLPSTASPSDAAVSPDGNFLYITDASTGLLIFDCSDRAAPKQIATYVRENNSYATAVTVAGNLVFYADSRKISVLDCTDPSSPVLVASYDSPGTPRSLAFDESDLFVADDSAGVEILRLGDVSQPLIKIEEPTIDGALTVSAEGIDLVGTASDAQGLTRVFWSSDRGGSGLAQGTTNWTVIGIPLLEGTNVITVSAEDTNGNVATDTITVTAAIPDVTVPVIGITGPRLQKQFTVSQPEVRLSGIATDDWGIASINWTNERGGEGEIELVDGGWEAGEMTLLEGPNPITVTATDAAGNLSEDSVVIFYTPPDGEAPTVTIDFPTLDPTYTTEVGTISLSGESADDQFVQTVAWSSSRGASGTASGTAPWSVNDIVLLPGLNVLDVTATDASDNETTDTLSVTYVPAVVPTPTPAPNPTATPVVLLPPPSQPGGTPVPGDGSAIGEIPPAPEKLKVGGVVERGNKLRLRLKFDGAAERFIIQARSRDRGSKWTGWKKVGRLRGAGEDVETYASQLRLEKADRYQIRVIAIDADGQRKSKVMKLKASKADRDVRSGDRPESAENRVIRRRAAVGLAFVAPRR